ncbi:putative NADPH-dependent butanol dehydrogenase [uncultured delta proteobacterium]|uniref:Putative NADPH-dependent butanol dehydrogenase n=1 Tax=uncultured delta proteobacterium TaxID=34034 RepID=A0A212KEJ0_9DELT|nr:putative NADPH-dependent butanol dehydrogenase [uncultured delta proteobacterium]
MLAANFPRRILFGQGSIEFVATLKAKRAFCIVDTVFHQYNPQLFAGLEAIFKKQGTAYHICFGQGQEPTLEYVQESAVAMREFGPDLILAIGGGSVLDAAKVMEVYYEHPEITLAQLSDRFNLPPIRRKAKFVAVPTTSGTGSEVTAVAVLYVPSGNPDMPYVKRGIADTQLIPDYVILDPAYTLTMPASITAATGLDAFVHAMEGYVCNKPKNAFSDGFALEAMKKVVTYLPLVLKEPDNLEYRSQMQIAATMGGLELASRASGASHGIGKQVATLKHMPHGTSVTMMLPAVIRANASVCLKEYAAIARYIGVNAADDKEALEGLLAVLEDLLTVAKCPRTIADIGLDKETFMKNLDLLITNSQNDAAMKGNPRELSPEEIRGILMTIA